MVTNSMARENQNIWWYLFKYKKLRLDLLKGSYFWQDSFVTYWNKFLGCRLTGHNVKLNGDNKPFCFKCYKEMKSKKWKAIGILMKHAK